MAELPSHPLTPWICSMPLPHSSFLLTPCSAPPKLHQPGIRAAGSTLSFCSRLLGCTTPFITALPLTTALQDACRTRRVHRDAGPVPCALTHWQ